MMQCFRVVCVVSFLAISAGTAAAQDKLIVATLRSVSQACFWVALDRVLFYKEYGLEVLPVNFSGGTQTITSLMSGDVQVTTTGGSTAINAKLKGGDAVLISTILGTFLMHFTYPSVYGLQMI
jgi:ABC-type nitrate/sulfonate/bicarbonate transport system substrate-binding protein